MAHRFYWSMGALFTSLGVLENAYTAHTRTAYNEKDKVALDNAVRIQLLNGMGLMLLSLKAKKGVLMHIPGAFIFTGSVLFPGMIFYSRIYDDKRFVKLVMVGGSSTVLGWAAMAII